MVFSSLAARSALVVLAIVSLQGCSGSDRVPLLDIGAGPARGDVLIGRVDPRRDGRQLIGRVDAPTAYAPARANTAAQSGIAELSPTSAPTTQFEQPLAAEATVIPDGGVDMDAGLGVGAGTYASADLPSTQHTSAEQSPTGDGIEPQIVTPVGAMAIAEGSTSQPVVDGIGFDDPEQIATGPITDGNAAPAPMQVASDGAGEILPLSVDNGNTGMTADESVAPVEPEVDCSLYLDKRNCPRG